jgi:large conductance mechanosensitive channel
MGIVKEFRDFAMKGNVVDMAVGIVIGAAFTSIVQSLVKDILTPPLGLLKEDANFTDVFLVLSKGKAESVDAIPTLADAQAAGAVTINFGLFINACISFVIVAIALFMVVKAINRIKRKEQAAPPAPAGPTKDQELLTEIRDLLKTKG